MTRKRRLPKREVERIRGKYSFISKFPYSLAFLSQSPQFLNARSRLLEMGYLNWQILQAAIGMIGNFRLYGDTLQAGIGGVDEGRRWGARMMAYSRFFLEDAETPLPPQDSLTGGDLERRILLDGLPWLWRRNIDYPKQPIDFEGIRPLLERHGYFSVDPRPEDFIFPLEV